jgi:lysophospholipase L1-like esterase
MIRRWLPFLLLPLLLRLPSSAAAAGSAEARWEPEIRAFEAADRTNAPAVGGIVFVGSSSVRLWKTLAEDFKGWPVVNRGFGGSQLSDSVLYAERIILPYRPRQVLLYAGDNDLAAGKSPDQVFSDFQAFVAKIQHALPQARISFISVKPSPARWALVEPMRRTNQLIAEFVRTHSNLDFIDVFNPMLGGNGQPRPEIFAADKLHLNAQGYALWSETVRPHLLPAPRQP